MSKLAVITGADGGMGKEITRAVAEAGYHVIMLCYTLFKGEERKNQMILETGNKEIEVTSGRSVFYGVCYQCCRRTVGAWKTY